MSELPPELQSLHQMVNSTSSLQSKLSFISSTTGLVLEEPRDSISCLSTSPKYLVLGTWANSIEVWDLFSQKRLFRLTGHSDKVNCVHISPNSHLIFSGSEDCAIKIWKGPKFRNSASLTGHCKAVNSICLTSDGGILASSSSDQTIRLWDLENEKDLKLLECTKANCLQFSRNNSMLVSGCGDGIIRIWDLAKNCKQHRLEGHTGKVSSILFTSDDKCIVSSSHDSLIIIWDLSSLIQIYSLRGLNSPILDMCISDKYIYCNTQRLGIYKWNIQTRLLEFYLPQTNTTHMALTQDRNLMAAVEGSKIIKIIDLEKKKESAVFGGHWSKITCMCVDNCYLVTGSQDNTIRIWNMQTYKQECVFVGHTAWVTQVMCKFGSVFSASKDGTVREWDIEKRTQVRSISRKYRILAVFHRKPTLV